MASIAKLSVQLSVNSARFSTGLKRAGKRLTAFRASIKRLSIATFNAGKRLATMGVVMGGVLAAAFAVIIKRQMELIDTTAKVAQKLGITTEALLAMRFAAERTGVAINTFDMGLQRMVRRISEAAVGMGEAQGALQELGLDVDTIAQMGADEQFRTIADAMQGVGSQADRVRLAMRLFDSEGVALVNTLAGGSQELDAMAARLAELGGTFSALDAAVVEEANDAFGELKALLGGIVNIATIQLAPIITEVANRLVEAALAGEGLGPKVTAAMKMVAKGIFGVVKMVDTLRREWKLWHSAVLIAAADFAETIAMFTGSNTMQAFADSLALQAQEIANAIGAMGTPPSFAQWELFFNQITERARESAAATLAAGGTEGGLSAAAIAAMIALQKEGDRLTKALRSPWEVLNDEIKKYTNLLNEGVISQETFNRAANKALDTYIDGVKNANGGLEDQIDLVKELKQETGKFGVGKFAALNTPFSTPFAAGESPSAAAKSASRTRQRDPQLAQTNALLQAILSNGQQRQVMVYG